MFTMFNFKNWKRHFCFLSLLTFFISLCFIVNVFSHKGKHNLLEKGKIYATPISFFTVHSGLDFDRWADANKPIFITSNLHPLGKYQLRDVEWTDGFKRKFWNPQPPEKIKFWLRAYVTGFGYVEFSDFKATVYGQTFGPKVTEQDKVGYYVSILPHYNLEENYDVDHHLEGPNFNTAPGTSYNWTASGKVKLIPVHYALGGSVGGGPGGNFGWTKDTSLAPTEYSQGGSWVVEHRTFKNNNKLSGNYRCAGCSEKASSQYAHRITCANPQDNTQYYFCLQTEKWAHLYEETCSGANCADTGVYRCTHSHSDPSPPPPDPNPPDIAGSCGHSFPTTQIASHEPSVGSCGHTYSPCTPGDHNTLVNGSCPSGHTYYACQESEHTLQGNCPETDANGNTCTVTNFYACESHTHQYSTLITYACGVHSGPPSGASSDHSTVISGYSGSFYECTPHTNGSCGHTYKMSNASTHALQASCTETNSNGDSCTVTSFYACQSHTHQYPAPTLVVCGRAACTQTVSSTDEHRETCGAGHLYWSCKSSDVHLHKTRTCRRSGCGQSWRLCTSEKPTCLVNSSWKCRAQ